MTREQVYVRGGTQKHQGGVWEGKEVKYSRDPQQRGREEKKERRQRPEVHYDAGKSPRVRRKVKKGKCLGKTSKEPEETREGGYPDGSVQGSHTSKKGKKGKERTAAL